ncbi:MAG TPA: pyrroline-5-carboxylate reductase [Gaiellales bacterium]|jgi:pyrroline-5-carboxylate reductase
MSASPPVLGLLGAGNMASAMVAGWVKADPEMAGRILVTDRGSGRAAELAARYGLRHTASNAELVEAADIVVLCVKPVDVERVLREVSDLVTPRKAIASVAAGVGTATLETILDVDAPVFRFMPNVGVRVGAGTLAYSSGRFTDTAAEQAVLGVFSLLGEVVPLEERLFDAATALSGSGPAFLGLIIEAFEDAGIVAGLTHRDARRLFLSTVAGTASLLREEELGCADLRRMVTSPGGTAAAGLAAMERGSVRGSIIDGVSAAVHRAGELG